MSYEYFTEIAPSYREAENLVTQKYGERARILQRRQKMVGGFFGLFRKDAVEVSGYVPLEPVRKTSSLRPSDGYRPAANRQASGNAHSAKPSESDLAAAKEQILKAAGISDGGTMSKILIEIKNLREEVSKTKQDEGPSPRGDELPTLAEMRSLLEENEFSHKYIQHIIAQCRNLSMADLEDRETVQQKVLEWISESVNVHASVPRARPRVVVLVGPTGVGKTTSIAKLAAQYHLGKIDGRRHSVRIITIDNYRIGAKKQIETYGDIMNIPVESAETPDELKKWLDLYYDVDMIFVDTIGRSPNESETLGRMNKILSVCGAGAEVHLALSASTRATDMKRIMQQFEPFNYQAVLVTKTDETMSLGTVVSCLWEKNKEVSFITDGQSVPHDLKAADKKQFLKRLSGFRVDQQRLETAYEKLELE